MPGQKDFSKPGASFLTPWAIHRSGIAVADVLPDSAPHVATFLLISPLDLSRNINGLTNQIWVVLERVSGSGTADVALYMDETGTLALVRPFPYLSVGTQAGVATLATTPLKFTNLLAGKYRVLLTALSATSSWKIHVCHT